MKIANRLRLLIRKVTSRERADVANNAITLKQNCSLHVTYDIMIMLIGFDSNSAYLERYVILQIVEMYFASFKSKLLILRKKSHVLCFYYIFICPLCPFRAL